MDFILNIVSEPNKKKNQNHKKNKNVSISLDKDNTSTNSLKTSDFMCYEAKTVDDTDKSQESFKTKSKPMRAIIPSQFRKRKIASDAREEPVAKQKKSFLNLLSNRKEKFKEKEEKEKSAEMKSEDEEANESNNEEEKKSNSERVKRQNKEERESAFNNLVSLMSEPVETKTEALFSSQQIDNTTELHPFLKKYLTEKMHLEVLTEIQHKSLGPVLAGRHALIKAQTGSGKTLAYALPLVQRMQAQEPPLTRSDGPVALILVPTRELVTQTQAVFSALLRPFVRIVSGALSGGIRKKAQKASLRKGLNVLVATPQRLLDHMRTTACLDLSRLQYLVIDEADRLLELGFERAIAAIHSRLYEDRAPISGPMQTILLSATLTPGVERLAGLALEDPMRLSVLEETEAIALPVGLRHFVISIPTKQRLVTLAAFLLLKCRYSKSSGKVIVFMATQDAVEFHFTLFKETIACVEEDLILPSITSDMKVFRLHGAMSHEARVGVFREFSACAEGSVLLTTDVACRGLDVPRVAWVVQYHVPGKPVDYVHRVGRTARAGGSGKALLFLQPEENDYLRVLQGLGVQTEPLPMGDLLQAALVHANNVRRKKKGRLLSDAESACTRLQFEFQRFLQSDEGAACQGLAEQAFLSYLRFYASFSGEMRDIFRFKSLHLGHVAKSFALKDAPKDIAKRVTGRSFGRTQSDKTVAAKSDVSSRPIKIDVGHRDMLAEFGL